MGQTKRRAAARREQIAVGAETTIRDIERGDEFQARMAGSPSEFLARYREVAKRHLAGERPIASVPCDGCRACCSTQVRVPVDPDIEPAHSLRHLDVVRDDDGLRLRKTAGGSCIHLTSQGCGYEHRPAACRFYDCRVFGLAGVRTTPAAKGACEPSWCFSPETPEDFTLLMLAQLGAQRFAGEHPGGFDDSDLICAASLFAQKHLPKATAAITELRHLPGAKRKALADRLCAHFSQKR